MELDIPQALIGCLRVSDAARLWPYLRHVLASYSLVTRVRSRRKHRINLGPAQNFYRLHCRQCDRPNDRWYRERLKRGVQDLVSFATLRALQSAAAVTKVLQCECISLNMFYIYVSAWTMSNGCGSPEI
jgi:hypothetical protein